MVSKQFQIWYLGFILSFCMFIYLCNLCFGHSNVLQGIELLVCWISLLKREVHRLFWLTPDLMSVAVPSELSKKIVVLFFPLFFYTEPTIAWRRLECPKHMWHKYMHIWSNYKEIMLHVDLRPGQAVKRRNAPV